MITLENIKEVLLSLGYTDSQDKYTYHFDEFDCNIEVDFRNNKIIYPEDRGLVVNERQTCNFSDKENFVVLECIHRLLLKGYKPSHIEIEKRWTLGHSQKSGRADICVMNETGSDMLAIIECKTYGAEFENELKNLKADGGQLFSYYQQEQSTKWLMLYATGFVDNKIEHQNNTISVFDTEEVLEKFAKNKSIKLYDDAHSKEKAFEVWKETYEQKIYGDLIFADDTIAYNIGEKPLRKKDLKEFNPKDKIVNKFEEILRHNNVSDKENAFNKLVALFICKLVDEITKQDDDIVDFQYKFGTDTYETLLDRLQRLYKEGMDKFMKEEIFYVSSEYPLALFSSYKGQNRKNAINDLKETFRKLKFYSNSDFAFKDVHNEELFLQNGKILVEVVKLFENYKIVYSSKHQFLGDLFEQLLNQGFKQNEGQFFTPIPITRFIWECLPIENIAKNLKGDKYPKIIDYACGGIGLIERKKQGLGKPNIIYVKDFMSEFRSECKNYTSEVKNLHLRSVETTPQEMKNVHGSNPNRNNTEYSNPDMSLGKSAYGSYQNVYLTEKEYLELKEKISYLDELIERLSSFMKSNDRTYKDHKATLISWYLKEKPKPKEKEVNDEEYYKTDYGV